MKGNQGIIPLFSTPVYNVGDTGFRCSEKEFGCIDNLSYVPSSAKTCLLSKNQFDEKRNS